ncbi:MAG: PQQ-binding-like beta-propeller repeat protein [Verrucomicrobia bacterium]|nr:MAG: PQQ-binding-like beta-propeller repeat protein [Verrucomicrobiota bacterium]
MKHAPLFSLTALLTSLVLSSTAADWPNFRGPDHNGISKETGWASQWSNGAPKQLWKAKVGLGFATLSVSNGRVYTTGNASDTDTVFCFDADTGKALWKNSYPAPRDAKYYEGGTSATPTVDGDRVYTISKRGILHCLGAADGKVVWTNNLQQELGAKIPEWGFAGSFYIEGDLAILNFGTAGTALDKRTGKVVWTSGTDVSGYSTPMPVNAGGERAVILAVKQDVVAVKIKDGKELWRFPWKTQYDVNAPTPILSGSKVFISSGYNHGGGVFDISQQPPKEIWNNKNMRNHMASSILWKGHLYGIDENQLRCLDFDTGEVKWTDKVSGKGALMIADGKLIVLSERGELLVAEASPAAFKPISRVQVVGGKCWAAPVLANGKIYCRTGPGDVVCVDVSGK